MRTTAVVSAVAALMGAAALQSGPAAAATARVADPPANLRVTDLQSVRVIVAWDPVPNASGYTVSLTLAGMTSYHSTNATDKALNVMWNKTYQVAVRASVQGVETAWSEPITVTPPFPTGFDLPSPPANLRVERDDRGEITLIRWDPPATDSGPFVYLLYIDSPEVPGWGDPSGLWDLVTEPRSDPSTNLVGAHIHLPGQSITVWVMATDSVGRRGLSDPLVLTCCPF